MRDSLAVAAAVLTAALLLGVWLQLPGVNGPEEWRWAYRQAGFERDEGAGLGSAAAWAGLAGLGCLIALLAAVPALPGAQAGARPGAQGAGLGALVVAGFAFTALLCLAGPGGFGGVCDSLVSRNSFGYLWDSGLAPETAALLADYPRASATLNQHSVTHPPGPILAVRALDRLTRGWPPPAPGERGLGGAAARAIARERARAHSHGRPLPDRLPGPWTVVLLAVLLPALSAFAAAPLYGLARGWGLDPATARLAAGLWLLVPARSLFTPSFDQALPLLLLGAAWFASGKGAWRSLAAGLLAWAACFISYGCLAALPLLAWIAAEHGFAPRNLASAAREQLRTMKQALRLVPAAASAEHDERTAWRGSAGRATLVTLGFLLPWPALALGTGFNPWTGFRTALALHHRIAVAPRGYATWLAFNPYDFALLLGPPILILAFLAILAASAPGTAGKGSSPPMRAAACVWWALLCCLVLSGGVRGEVGRIWLPWMPFACIFAAAAAAARWGPSPLARGALLLGQAALTLTLAANMVFIG